MNCAIIYSGETYKVHQLKLDILHNCNLKCEICNTCLQEFRNHCPDSAIGYNLCKHIHITWTKMKDVSNGSMLKIDDHEIAELVIQSNEEAKELSKQKAFN